jgi:hypothetical protein
MFVVCSDAGSEIFEAAPLLRADVCRKSANERK